MFRFRNIFLVLGSVLVLAALFFTDPDKGVSTAMLLQALVVPVLAVGVAHLARKALFDYFDMGEAIRKACETPEGSSRVVLAACIVLAALLLLFGGQVHAAPLDVKSYIPANAQTYAPVLKAEQVRFWGDHPAPELLAGLVEQESCLSLTHSKCWNPASRLKTSREEGAGLGQITRAYRADGSLRFDALAEMRDRHAELQGWSWANVYQRPDLQLRAIVLMSRGNYQDIHRLVKDPQAALAFADAAYNGGMGGVQSDRRACGLKRGCDPQRWFGNVEATCTKSRAALYGKRSACDINREHVHNVMLVRSAKYRPLMEAT